MADEPVARDHGGVQLHPAGRTAVHRDRPFEVPHALADHVRPRPLEVEALLEVEQRRRLLELALEVHVLAVLRLQDLDLAPEPPVLRLQRADVGQAAEERTDRPEHGGHGVLHGPDHREQRSADRFEGAGVPLAVVDADPAALTPLVDGVLIVAQAGKTTADEAKSTSELLGRLGAPVVGVALNRVRSASTGGD